MLNPLSNISLRKRQVFGGWGTVALEDEDEQMYPCNTLNEQGNRSLSVEHDFTGENLSDPVNIVEPHGM